MSYPNEKWIRFYFQPFITNEEGLASLASHENLIRLYYQTEAYAGEYDIEKADTNSSPESNVHIITARFQVMAWP